MKKKTILSIIGSLEKINVSFIKNLEAGIQVPTEILADCQEFAISVGNAIEQCGESGEEIVRLLEAYCENIYQISCQQSDVLKCRKLTKKIQKQLIQIRNHVKYDLPDDRKQVVFLPYKASMWDSLESVWKAADADPNCDAYVIPIPYFDKNPDGSFCKMHYEGNEYPDYVPIVSWEEYDIAEHHPDIIYIHNPYDEFNFVTSVHPAFYAKKLKEHTNKLVYIPYFVLSEIEPDDHKVVKSMEHFCTVPGVIHADQVIVQSEKMRQIYINVLSETLGEETRPIWEKKILGSGSPKIDKVLHMKKEELEIPEEWLEIIEKPDGSWKKIIFYNTSVSALLQHDVKMLQKMKYVFGIFKENQEEVALLWRPHPLIQATIESMRPQLWEAYKEIKDRYIAEGWGIYDGTADMDRAVILSDMYYGDGSSVEYLYRAAGKMTVLQSMQLGKNRLKNAMEWIVKCGEKLYFSIMEFNGIGSIHLTNNHFEVERCVQEENACIYRAYGAGAREGDKIYMAPLLSDKLVIYNLKTRQYEYVGLPAMDAERLRHQKSSQIIVHGYEIFLLPKTEYYPYIIQINEISKKIKIFDLSMYCEDQRAVFCDAAAKFGDDGFYFCLHGKLYSFLYGSDDVREVSYKISGEVRDISIDDKGIVILEDEVTVRNHDGIIIDEISFENIVENEKVNKVCKRGNYIYLYSNYSTNAGQIYRVNILTKEWKKTGIKEASPYFMSHFEDEREFFFSYYIDGNLCMINENLDIQEYKIESEFDINQYILQDPDWWHKLGNTYHCLNEVELLREYLGIA